MWPAKSNRLTLWPLTSHACCSLSHREALLSERHLCICFSWDQPQLSVFRVLFLLAGSREGNLLISTNAVCLDKVIWLSIIQNILSVCKWPKWYALRRTLHLCCQLKQAADCPSTNQGAGTPQNRADKSQLSLPTFCLLKYWHDFLHFHFINKDLVWEVTESRVPRRPGRW